MYSGHKLSIFESFSKTNSDHLWFYWELTKVKLNHMYLGKSFCIQTHHHIVVHMSRSECDDEPSVHWKLNWSGGWDEYSHCTFRPTKSLFCRKTTRNENELNRPKWTWNNWNKKQEIPAKWVILKVISPLRNWGLQSPFTLMCWGLVCISQPHTTL